jgi:hypothetical protein
MLTELINDPAPYLHSKLQQQTVRIEVVLVLLVGALGSFGHYYFIQRFTSLVDVAGFAEFRSIGYVIEPIGGLFVFWIGSAVVAHLIAGQFNTRGPILRVLKMSAWATVPIALGNAARSIAMYLAYRDVTNDDVNITVNGFEEKLDAFLDMHIGDPVMIVATIVLVFTVVWYWYLFSIGLRIAKEGISEQEARIAAGIPSAILAIYLLYALLGNVGVL